MPQTYRLARPSVAGVANARVEESKIRSGGGVPGTEGMVGADQACKAYRPFGGGGAGFC